MTWAYYLTHIFCRKLQAVTPDDNSDSEQESSDDGIVLDKALVQAEDVQALRRDPEYQTLAAQTVKARKEAKQNNRFRL